MASPFLKLKNLTCFLVLAFIAQVDSQNISCSDRIITAKGSFPEKLSEIPSDFHCVMKFEIPSGFVVRFSLKSDTPIENLANVIYVRNAQNTINNFPTLEEHSYIFATARTAEMHVHTGNKTVNMLIKYHFIDIRHFIGTIVDSGTVQSLNIEYGTFLTFRASETNSNIQIELATFTEHPENDIFSHVFVYEGLDLEGDCLGTLADYKNKMTTPSYQEEDSTDYVTYLSIVYFNSRQNYTDSFVIANTKNSLEKFNNYTFRIINWDEFSDFTTKGLMHEFSDFTTKGSAITFICKYDCKAMYIEELKFLEGDGMVEIMPFAPYHRKPRNSQEYDVRRTPIITYKNSTFNATQELPQQIPIAMFTIIIKNATVVLLVTTTESRWLIPYKGRKVTIYSPSYWNVSAPAGFEVVITPVYQLGGYDELWCSINLLSMNATGIGDRFRIFAGHQYDPHEEHFIGCKDDLEVCYDDVEQREIREEGHFVTVEFIASTWPSAAIVEIRILGLKRDVWTFWGFLGEIFSSED